MFDDHSFNSLLSFTFMFEDKRFLRGGNVTTLLSYHYYYIS